MRRARRDSPDVIKAAVNSSDEFRVPKVEPHLVQTLDLAEVLLIDTFNAFPQARDIETQGHLLPLVQAYYGLAAFIVFFLSHSKESEGDAVAKALQIDRQELTMHLLTIVRNRLFSLRLGTEYEKVADPTASLQRQDKPHYD